MERGREWSEGVEQGSIVYETHTMYTSDMCEL